MKLEFTYLRSRLARRIFWLFVVCALLPISVLAVVSLFSVSYELKDQKRRRLNQATHDEGMIIFERLTLLDANLRTIAAGPDLFSGKGEPKISFNVDAYFAAVAHFFADENSQLLAGQSLQTFSLSDQEQAFVNSGKSLLKVDDCGQPEACIYLVVRPPSQTAGHDLIVGKVRHDFLWGSDELPESMSLCVLDQQDRALNCSTKEQQILISQLSGPSEWKQEGKTFVAQSWKLPMKAKFLEDHWTILIGESGDTAFSSLGSFRRNFPLVMLLALWVVLLLSIIEIRRTLIPLEKLREGTRRIAAGEFDAHVDVRSQDEFQELASSFNYMAGRIETHVHSLKTLNEIDRAILSSRDLDQIVKALVSRLPELLPYEVAGITVIGADPLRQSITHAARSRGALHALNTQITADDLNCLKQEEEIFVTVDASSSCPAYLTPLVAEGATRFLVLPVSVDGKLAAVLSFGRAATCEWTKDDRQQARRVADQVAVAISNAQLVSQLKELRWGALLALARAIDAVSPWTAGHSERVTSMALKIARELGLSRKEVDTLHAGGLLHDIGKIGTPLHLLERAGPLTHEERLVVQDHVMIGVRILGPVSGFEEFLPIVREHHEWFNGKGYPQGIAGENISFLARILAVADVCDALVSDRPYRKGMPNEQVEQIIRDGSGTQFDPRVVNAFLRIIAREGLSGGPDIRQPELVEAS